MNAVQQHFSRVAADYPARSRRGLWGTLRRREARAVQRVLGDLAGQTVLELGCGAGYYTERLLSWGAAHVVAVDQCAGMLTHIDHERVRVVHAALADVRAPDGCSIILAAGVLEFVPNAEGALARVTSSLPPGARVVCLLPSVGAFGTAYAWMHARHEVEVQLYDEERIASLAGRTGCRVEALQRVWPSAWVVALRRGAT